MRTRQGLLRLTAGGASWPRPVIQFPENVHSTAFLGIRCGRWRSRTSHVGSCRELAFWRNWRRTTQTKRSRQQSEKGACDSRSQVLTEKMDFEGILFWDIYNRKS